MSRKTWTFYTNWQSYKTSLWHGENKLERSLLSNTLFNLKLPVSASFEYAQTIPANLARPIGIESEKHSSLS